MMNENHEVVQNLEAEQRLAKIVVDTAGPLLVGLNNRVRAIEVEVEKIPQLRQRIDELETLVKNLQLASGSPAGVPNQPKVEKVERIPQGWIDQTTMVSPASQPVTTSKPSDVSPEQQKLLDEARQQFGGN